MMDTEEISGSFEIAGKAVTLYREGKVYWKNMKFVSDQNELIHPFYFLTDSGLKLFNMDIITPYGQELVIGKVKAFCMMKAGAKATNDVKLRDYPGTAGKVLDYPVMDAKGESSIQYVPSGSEVEVLARTLKEEKVGAWNNYWYYVRVKYYGPTRGYVSGWMFAEFIELEPR